MLRSVEDDRAVTVHEDPSFRMPGHCSCQYRCFDILTALDEVGDVAVVIDASDILLYDRPLVEIRGDVVGRGTDDLHSAGVRLVIRLCALEAGQERVMDVDDAALQPGAEIGGEDLHIAREDNELDVELIDESAQTRLGSVLGLTSDRNVVEVVAVKFGQ